MLKKLSRAPKLRKLLTFFVFHMAGPSRSWLTDILLLPELIHCNGRILSKLPFGDSVWCVCKCHTARLLNRDRIYIYGYFLSEEKHKYGQVCCLCFQECDDSE